MKLSRLPLHLFLLLFPACSLVTLACTTPLAPYNLAVRLRSDKPLSQRLDESRTLIEKRKKQAYQYTLAEKAAIFECQQDFCKLVGPINNLYSRQVKVGCRPSSASLAFSSERLAMLAYKFKATGDQKVLAEINSLLESYLEIDTLFGKLGQMPRNVIFSRKSPGKFNKAQYDLYFHEHRGDLYVYFQDDAHGNTFPNHFFGLYAAYVLTGDEGIKQKASEAIKNHITYLLDEGFVLKRLDGKPSTYGDLTGNEYIGLAKNALLARLMILEVSWNILSDLALDRELETLTSRIENQLKVLKEKGSFEAIQNMSFMIANLSFSTSSSNRRVFLNLYLLAAAAGKREGGEKYSSAFRNYWESKKRDYNPFYTFLYLTFKPKEMWSFENRIINAMALEYLKSFPLDRDKNEILNSFFKDDDVDVDRFPVVTKHGLVPRNKTPLPIYRRGVRRHEWRGNAFRLNENINKDGATYAYPLDFLLVYYMGLARGFISLEEQAIDQGKLDDYISSEIANRTATQLD